MSDHDNPTHDAGPESDLEAIVARFEAAWLQGNRPSIDEFLQRDDGVSEPGGANALLWQLVHAELTFRLKAGEPARVEEYLARYPQLAADRQRLVQLVRGEFDVARRLRPGVALADYAARFPELARELETRADTPPGVRGASPVRLNCPHCQNPIEVVPIDESEELVCPSCGSNFHLEQDRTVSWGDERLPKLGKFELIQSVGRGSFGTVYRARDTQLDRIVAVKLPRSGTLGTAADEDRFIRDARSTAQLHHPGIVPVYEVGRSEQFPYIVMEFVEGSTLADVLTSRKLGFRESADLVMRVAEALEHAHQQGIVHRDLKPSNIMLSADGMPRLMDFGLAKRDAGEITMTMDGQILGTPAYMSPEQAAGESHKADARSDIYSLGVILYQLLTGELPFRGNMRMLVQQVLNDEPRAPRKVNDRIPRDLETIALKCLQKDSSKRFATAADLAADIRRHLNGELIHARPISPIERAARWCRRNWIPTTAAAGVVVVFLAGFAGVAWQWLRAERSLASAQMARDEAQRERELARAAERQEAAHRSRAEQAERLAAAEEARALESARQAKLEAETARQVSDFLVGLFQGGDPLALDGQKFEAADRLGLETTTLEILRKGTEQVRKNLTKQPVVQATLMDAIGNVHTSLGLFDEAESLLSDALEARRQIFGREHSDVASSMQHLATLNFLIGNYKPAITLARESLQIRKALFGEDHVDVARSQLMLGWFLASAFGRSAQRDEESQKLLRSSIDIRKRLGLEPSREGAFARVLLAGASRSRPGDAAKLIKEASDTFLAVDGDRRPSEALSNFQMGVVAQTIGNYRQASVLFRKALVVAEPVFGPRHPAVTYLQTSLAQSLARQGDEDAATALFRQVLDSGKATYGSRPYLAFQQQYYADFLTSIGRHSEARDVLNEALQIRETYLGVSSPEVGLTHELLAQTSVALGDMADAKLQLQKALESYRQVDAEFYSGWLDYAWASLLPLALRLDEPSVAAECCDHLEKINPDGSLKATSIAEAVPSFLEENQLEAYSRACNFALGVVGDKPDPQAANTLAWTCVVCPRSDIDYRRVVKLAKGACDASSPDPNVLNTLGAALYRAEQYPEALNALESSLNAGGKGGSWADWVFLAMTCQKLGRTTEASSWLGKVDEYSTAARKGANPRTLGVEARLLHAEAKLLIRGAKE